jgi:hypothetical protein
VRLAGRTGWFTGVSVDSGTSFTRALTCPPRHDWIGLAVVIGETVGLAITESVTDLGQAIPRVPRCIMRTTRHLGRPF